MAECLQFSEKVPQVIADRIKATFFGQCVGDTLGLLTEFMTKEEAKACYGKKPKTLKYKQREKDVHRLRWNVGDWTDDTDQMILILQSILYNKGEIVITDFSRRMRRWVRQGFPELGDFGGIGIGTTTARVVDHPVFVTEPHKAASDVWERHHRKVASNGCVMRTSILGLHEWNDIEKVTKNALSIGKCTHFDPRCQASVVAVSTCIAKMLQYAAQKGNSTKKLPVEDIIKQSYDLACGVLETDAQREELWKYMNCKKLKNLSLDESSQIGYTYKCMGSGFWAVRQDNYEKAMMKLIMEGGDADTNGAVAGSMLACKLGLEAIPDHWISDLLHKDMMLDLHRRFIKLQSEMNIPVEDRSCNDDLSVENLIILGEKHREEEKERHLQQEEMKKKQNEGT